MWHGIMQCIRFDQVHDFNGPSHDFCKPGMSLCSGNGQAARLKTIRPYLNSALVIPKIRGQPYHMGKVRPSLGFDRVWIRVRVFIGPTGSESYQFALKCNTNCSSNDLKPTFNSIVSSFSSQILNETLN